MSKVLVTESYLSDIADSIRAKKNTADTFTPAQMSGAIDTIETPNLQAKTVSPSTSAQTVSPDTGYNGLSRVTVNAISPTKAAQTYTPGTANQTIASGRWLTGAQTIKGDANLVAGNIKKDVSIFGVTGTYEGSGGGGISGNYYTIQLSFTNPSGVSEFAGIAIYVLTSDAHEDRWGEVYYTDRVEYLYLNNPEERISIMLPIEYYGIVIEPRTNSPEGMPDYSDNDLSLTGSLTYLDAYEGFQIRVQGDGTITIDGVEYDP